MSFSWWSIENQYICVITHSDLISVSSEREAPLHIVPDPTRPAVCLKFEHVFQIIYLQTFQSRSSLHALAWSLVHASGDLGPPCSFMSVVSVVNFTMGRSYWGAAVVCVHHRVCSLINIFGMHLSPPPIKSSDWTYLSWYMYKKQKAEQLDSSISPLPLATFSRKVQLVFAVWLNLRVQQCSSHVHDPSIRTNLRMSFVIFHVIKLNS